MEGPAAVAPAMAFAADFGRRRPVEMQVATPKALLGNNIPRTVDSRHAVLHHPSCFAPALALPPRQVSTAKKHDGILGRWSGIDDARFLLCPTGQNKADHGQSHERFQEPGF